MNQGTAVEIAEERAQWLQQDPEKTNRAGAMKTVEEHYRERKRKNEEDDEGQTKQKLWKYLKNMHTGYNNHDKGRMNEMDKGWIKQQLPKPMKNAHNGYNRIQKGWTEQKLRKQLKNITESDKRRMNRID
jgi:hypothetical protein